MAPGVLDTSSMESASHELMNALATYVLDVDISTFRHTNLHFAL
jgi:hypothetical protein